MEHTHPRRGLARFGTFDLDPNTGELRTGRRRIGLQDQPVRMLVALLERPMELVTRDDLRQVLWPVEVFVDYDNSISKGISKIRDALGDSAEAPRFIETVGRRGYRFIAPVSWDADPLSNGSTAPPFSLPAVDSQTGTDRPSSGDEEPTAPDVSSSPGRWLPAVKASALLAGAIGLAALGTVIGWYWQPPTAPRLLTRTTISFPPGAQLQDLDRPTFALSPDGTRLVIAAVGGGKRQLYMRSLENMVARPIAGTERAYAPFFSPDSRWIGFLSGGKLQKIPVEGGTPTVLCDAPDGVGASWSSDDTIIFTPDTHAPLWRIKASGGTPHRLTELDPGRKEWTHRWPHVLPDGKAVLFSHGSGGATDARIMVQSMDGRVRRVLIEGGSYPIYVPTGHLLYARENTVMAVPFDAQSLEIRGKPVPILDGVAEHRSGAAHFSVSQPGTLVYLSKSKVHADQRLVSVDRRGVARPFQLPPRPYTHPRVSPDGRRVVMWVPEDQGDMRGTVWIYDIGQDSLRRVTTEANSCCAVWSPDGLRIGFATAENPTSADFFVLWQPVNGTGPSQRLTKKGTGNLGPESWSPDGEVLAVSGVVPQRDTADMDLWLLRMDGKQQLQPFLTGPGRQAAPAFSPDGRWLAYVTDESGREEVYVRAFPGSGGQWQVSTDGGREPIWARSGRELFYRIGDRLMAVPVSLHPSFSTAKARVLFEWPSGSEVDLWRPNYDVMPGGEQFIMLQSLATSLDTDREFHVVSEWFNELRQRTGLTR
jgi:serine/threonine-protein kinase